MAIGGETASNEALDALGLSLKTLADDYLPSLTVEDLGARCVELQTARQRLDGIIAMTVAEADRAGVALSGGVRTMAQYLAARMNIAPHAVRNDRLVGLWAGSYPAIEDALLDGRMSRQHADHVRKLENIRVTTAILRDQHLFVQWSEDLGWNEFRTACTCLLYTSPSPRDATLSRMPSSA